MSDETLLTPVSDEDPCGPDLRWDPAFMKLEQTFAALLSQDAESVVDGALASADRISFDELTEQVKALNARTRDLRVFAIRAEIGWREAGLPGFTRALVDLAKAAETWPDPHDGIHPRADPEDDDLGERCAALGKLINRAPVLAGALGWGANAELSKRTETGLALHGLFDHWNERLQGAFGPELPVCGAAWTAIRKLIGDPAQPAPGTDAGQTSAAAHPALTDAWDAIESALELLSEKDRHSPALPVLRLLMRWRSQDITEISLAMRASGVTLEQLLDSINKQLT